MTENLVIKQFTLGPFVNNLYLIYDKKTKDAMLIDASFEIENIIKFIKENSLNLRKVILTHGHIDHIYGVSKLKTEINPEIAIHKDDIWLYENINTQGEMFGFKTKVPPAPEILFDSNTNFEFSNHYFSIISCPGHTPGSISVQTTLNENNLVFTGDTLFNGSIGRTDLWGGSYETIEKSIRNVLYSLPENTIVYPGHGDETTIKKEKKSNAFVRAL